MATIKMAEAGTHVDLFSLVPRVAQTVAAAVAQVAMDSGVARIIVDPEEISKKVWAIRPE